MADIARCGKLAIAAQLCFWQRRRYALARTMRVGLVMASDDQIRLPKKLRGQDEGKPQSPDRGPKLSERHVFTLTGVYEGGGGMRRRPSRRGAETQFFTQAKGAHCPPFAARHVLYAPTLNALTCAVTDALAR